MKRRTHLDVLGEKVKAPSQRPRRSGMAGVEPAILVVVGDVARARVVHAALASLSPTVRSVTSAIEALRELEGLSPDLVVVDDELPLVRGLDLAGRIRAERRAIEVLLLTDDEAVVSTVERLRVERIGCLQKPFDVEQLKRAAAARLHPLSEQPASPVQAVFAARALEHSGSSPAEPSEASPAAPPPLGIPLALPEDLRVLVVDDDPLVRRALARALSRQRVTLAENGLAATRELERSQPDVIVSDLRMPEMDGLALAEEVRRRWPELADRIVFVSGTGSHIERAREEEPEHPVLRKPVAGPALESRIAEVLEQAMRARKQPPRS